MTADLRASGPPLSKSKFVAGWQCPKLLWWTVHEPQAKELQPDVVLQDLFDQGRLVEERARLEWPDGVLIEGDRHDGSRILRTRAAIDAGASVLFGASFEADGVFCAVDVLERTDAGWTLIEIKSGSSVKDVNYPDVAVQVHVVRLSGLSVVRAEVLHMNRDHRHPYEGPLFARTDVTQEVQALLPEIPARIAQQVAVLERAQVPEHAVGEHCWLRGDACAFHNRCWSQDDDHISNMWNVGPKKTLAWMQKGVHTMSGIPPTERLNDKQKRQLRAQRDGALIIEPGLAEAMRPAMEARRLGFLDFETVGRALPPWNRLGPWHQTAAQFSYHERGDGGVMRHEEFLAEGPENPTLPPNDPREAIARAMLEATADADVIVVYTHFEKTQIKALVAHLPHLEAPLNALRDKLWDLNPAVAENVYHPDFRGSFSLKDILTPLVPDLSYNDLVIVNGMVASVKIARLLFVSGRIPMHERDKTRRDLLEYCKRDTFATVRLVERLGALAASA